MCMSNNHQFKVIMTNQLSDVELKMSINAHEEQTNKVSNSMWLQIIKDYLENCFGADYESDKKPDKTQIKV